MLTQFTTKTTWKSRATWHNLKQTKHRTTTYDNLRRLETIWNQLHQTETILFNLQHVFKNNEHRIEWNPPQTTQSDQKYNRNISKFANTICNYQKTTQPDFSILNSRMMFTTWYNLKQAGQPKSTCKHLNNPNNQIERYLQPHRTVWDHVQALKTCKATEKNLQQPRTVKQIWNWTTFNDLN